MGANWGAFDECGYDVRLGVIICCLKKFFIRKDDIPKISKARRVTGRVHNGTGIQTDETIACKWYMASLFLLGLSMFLQARDLSYLSPNYSLS